MKTKFTIRQDDPPWGFEHNVPKASLTFKPGHLVTVESYWCREGKTFGVITPHRIHFGSEKTCTLSRGQVGLVLSTKGAEVLVLCPDGLGWLWARELTLTDVA